MLYDISQWCIENIIYPALEIYIIIITFVFIIGLILGIPVGIYLLAKKNNEPNTLKAINEVKMDYEGLRKYIKESDRLEAWCNKNNVPLREKRMKHYRGIGGSIRMQEQSKYNHKKWFEWMNQHKEEIIKAGFDWQLLYTDNLKPGDQVL